MQRINVKVTPQAKQNTVRGFRNGVLRVSLTTTPEDGRANKALITLLAKEWDISKSSITIARGDTTREKVITISGDLSADVRAQYGL